MSDDRSAALLLRVWLEDGADDFRARLTAVGKTSDGSVQNRTVALASSPGEALAAVRHWLDDFLREAARGVDDAE